MNSLIADAQEIEIAQDPCAPPRTEATLWCIACNGYVGGFHLRYVRGKPVAKEIWTGAYPAEFSVPPRFLENLPKTDRWRIACEQYRKLLDEGMSPTSAKRRAAWLLPQ